MAYTIYRKVKVLSLNTVNQTRTLRPKEIADPSFRRSDYSVSVARFSNVDYEITIADFISDLSNGQLVSIAVNDKFQLIALVNHSTGAEKSLKNNSINFSEIASTHFYMLIPGLLGFFIAKKAFDTVKYHNAGWGIIAATVCILLLILKGVAGQFFESARALKEILSV